MLIKHGPHPEEGCLVVLTLRHLRHIPVGALMQHQPRGGGGGGRPLHKYYMDPNPTCHTDGSGFWIQTLILKKKVKLTKTVLFISLEFYRQKNILRKFFKTHHMYPKTRSGLGYGSATQLCAILTTVEKFSSAILNSASHSLHNYSHIKLTFILF